MSDSEGATTRAPTRRQFLKLSGAGVAAAAAGLPLFHCRREERPALPEPEATSSLAIPKLGSWEDLHRQRWTWDSIAKGSHGWANCRSACAWDLYVKDGIVVREEQSATYEASEAGVPDFNPRGCQKGACYTEVM
jgi:anaerobic selenocysteine-containing dehydrogenase